MKGDRIFPDCSELSRAFGRVDLSAITNALARLGNGSEPPPVIPVSTEIPMPDENNVLLSLLLIAQGWADRARTSLVHIHTWDRATLVAGRRPEERALMAAALDAVDLVRAQPGGAALLAEFGIGVSPSALQTREALVQRLDGARGSVLTVRVDDPKDSRSGYGRGPQNGNGGA